MRVDEMINELLNGAPKTYDEKLAAAKEFLGERWVLHPNYKHDPRHFIKLSRRFENPLTARTLSESLKRTNSF